VKYRLNTEEDSNHSEIDQWELKLYSKKGEDKDKSENESVINVFLGICIESWD